MSSERSPNSGAARPTAARVPSVYSAFLPHRTGPRRLSHGFCEGDATVARQVQGTRRPSPGLCEGDATVARRVQGARRPSPGLCEGDATVARQVQGTRRTSPGLCEGGATVARRVQGTRRTSPGLCEGGATVARRVQAARRPSPGNWKGAGDSPPRGLCQSDALVACFQPRSFSRQAGTPVPRRRHRAARTGCHYRRRQPHRSHGARSACSTARVTSASVSNPSWPVTTRPSRSSR